MEAAAVCACGLYVILGVFEIRVVSPLVITTPRHACPAVGGPETGRRKARRHGKGSLLRDILSEDKNLSFKSAALCYSLPQLAPSSFDGLTPSSFLPAAIQRVPYASSRSSTTRCPRTQAVYAFLSQARNICKLQSQSLQPAQALQPCMHTLIVMRTLISRAYRLTRAQARLPGRAICGESFLRVHGVGTRRTHHDPMAEPHG